MLSGQVCIPYFLGGENKEKYTVCFTVYLQKNSMIFFFNETQGVSCKKTTF